MACKTSFELHHNFPKLAEESGFTFNTHRPRVHINWNKIKLIDIENLIRDRKFVMVEQHINDILDCVLESEFDVRILDEGVLKIFRLAQLAVEYQQFCRHYLDRSVFVLREEVTNLIQDLDTTKKSLREKEEENRKLRRKSKHSIRTPLPYGNENIATMILKTLNQNKGELFASTSQIDAMQYNKCSYCDKVFLNQLYLKSHISRRHANVLQIPQRDTIDGEVTSDKNEKLTNEVEELKTKLKQMEDVISNTCSTKNQATIHESSQIDNGQQEVINSTKDYRKVMKDAEVSTNEEGYILDKIKEWKKEEHEKYNEELSSMRKQIIEILNIKEKQDVTSVQNELKMMAQLHATINEQGSEILALKQELYQGESSEKEKRKKIEEQMAFWINRAEMQSNEYKTLLQKLNEVATEAQEFRGQVHAEKERAKQLEDLLEYHLNKTSPKNIEAVNKQNILQVTKHSKGHSTREFETTKDVQVKPTADVITLKKLQKQAQELLNLDHTSTSDSSSASNHKVLRQCSKKVPMHDDNVKKKTKVDKSHHEQDFAKPVPSTTSQTFDKMEMVKNKYFEKKQSPKYKPTISATTKKGNGYVYIPGSPLKIVRAKIIEEVNHRLISVGVDPLNNRLPQNAFQKQRKLLHEQQEFKFKKHPSREKVLHSIMCNLDQNTGNSSCIQRNEYVSPNKSSKTFSISSILSNVKTKALALVKSNETVNNKSYDDVAKKAIALLKTPPGSSHTSPLHTQRAIITSPDKKLQKDLKMNAKHQPSKVAKQKTVETHQVIHSSNESYSESDEQDNFQQQSSKILNDIIPSPIRRSIDNSNNDSRNSPSQSKTFLDANGSKPKTINVNIKTFLDNKDDSNDDVESIIDITPRKFLSEENLNHSKKAKGVLKNASSTSSLNKKKVLFDMEAIQMKSVSASPSQSITEKSDKERYESEINRVNLLSDEWDISSIENEPVRTTASKIQISAHKGPKIAELKQVIESQLTRRNPTLSTALVGGVDVLAAPMRKTSYGGSNTSLGSSILDDTDSVPVVNLKMTLKSKTAIEKDDSEIEISDLIDDRIVNKK